MSAIIQVPEYELWLGNMMDWIAMVSVVLWLIRLRSLMEIFYTKYFSISQVKGQCYDLNNYWVFFLFQYRVESMMLRMAKPTNYIAVSPGVQQRARQKAPEVIALTMEPVSRFYSDPVVLLDFQSLYPSIMIAYNYCFSTCLGKVEHIANADCGEYEFGCSSLRLSPKTLKVREHLKEELCKMMCVASFGPFEPFPCQVTEK
jgi:DNA polymerase elongation subunit (family B)